MLSNRVYDFLKAFVMVVAPTAASLYLALSPLHDIRHTTSTVAIFMALVAVTGVYLLISTRSYYNSDAPYVGRLVVLDDEGKHVYRLEADCPLEDLREMPCVAFKVGRE